MSAEVGTPRPRSGDERGPTCSFRDHPVPKSWISSPIVAIHGDRGDLRTQVPMRTRPPAQTSRARQKTLRTSVLSGDQAVATTIASTTARAITRGNFMALGLGGTEGRGKERRRPLLLQGAFTTRRSADRNSCF